MKIHPLTNVILAVTFVILVTLTHFPLNLMLAGTGFLLAGMSPRKSTFDPLLIFIRLYLIGITMLFLIQTVQFPKLTINAENLHIFFTLASRLLAIFAMILWLARNLRKEELFAFLIAIRLPMSLIFILFKAFWFVPKIATRSNDIIIAQRLRGVRVVNIFGKFVALFSSVNALFNSFFLEITESSIALTSKGIFLHYKKETMTPSEISWIDYIIIFAALGTITALVIF